MHNKYITKKRDYHNFDSLILQKGGFMSTHSGCVVPYLYAVYGDLFHSIFNKMLGPFCNMGAKATHVADFGTFTGRNCGQCATTLIRLMTGVYSFYPIRTPYSQSKDFLGSEIYAKNSTCGARYIKDTVSIFDTAAYKTHSNNVDKYKEEFAKFLQNDNNAGRCESKVMYLIIPSIILLDKDGMCNDYSITPHHFVIAKICGLANVPLYFLYMCDYTGISLLEYLDKSHGGFISGDKLKAIFKLITDLAESRSNNKYEKLNPTFKTYIESLSDFTGFHNITIASTLYDMLYFNLADANHEVKKMKLYFEHFIANDFFMYNLWDPFIHVYPFDDNQFGLNQCYKILSEEKDIVKAGMKMIEEDEEEDEKGEYTALTKQFQNIKKLIDVISAIRLQYYLNEYFGHNKIFDDELEYALSVIGFPKYYKILHDLNCNNVGDILKQFAVLTQREPKDQKMNIVLNKLITL